LPSNTTQNARKRKVVVPSSAWSPRLPLPILLEAIARMSFGYLRNQYGLRDRRPPARFISRTWRFLAAGRGHRHVVADMAGLQVLVPTSDLTIARSVYTCGDWDPLLVGTVFDALREFGHEYQGTVFLEVGANFGVYSLPAVAEFGFASAVAYEPDPSSFALLEANIERNGLRDRVSAHRAALSDKPGELVLSLGSGNAGDNRIVRDGAQPRRATVTVPARTFDNEVAADRIPLDRLGLVWLDVQGHEGQALAGARTLLESRVPIVMEYATGMLDAGARERLDELIASQFDVIVDLGWSALTNRLRFLPARSIHRLAPSRLPMETDLLLLHE
jgi:FkbM family methyltransferase